MKTRLQNYRSLNVVAAFVILLMSAGIAIAANWYDDADETIGVISVTELADWMIQGKADFATLYIAKELKKVKAMDNLICIAEDGFLEKELGKLPAYKKWVVVTAEGKLSQSTVNILGKSESKGVFLLEGGKVAWEEKVAAPSIDGLELDQNERVELSQVRPFFQNTGTKISTRSQSSSIVQPAAAVASDNAEEAEEEEEEEEEGC